MATHFSKTQIRQMGVSDLRTALSERGLDSTGLRSVLQNRLREAIFQNDLSQSNATIIDTNESGHPELLKIPKGPVFKRIPKASRLQACIAFTKVLRNVININDIKSWENLLSFARCAIGGSVRGGKKKKSQATFLNKRIEAFMSGNPLEVVRKKAKKAPSLKNMVSAKLAVADVTGAIRI